MELMEAIERVVYLAQRQIDNKQGGFADNAAGLALAVDATEAINQVKEHFGLDIE